MSDKFIIAKLVAEQIVYFIWHRNSEGPMEVTNRLEAMNLTDRDSVLCAESSMCADHDSPFSIKVM